MSAVPTELISYALAQELAQAANATPEYVRDMCVQAGEDLFTAGFWRNAYQQHLENPRETFFSRTGECWHIGKEPATQAEATRGKGHSGRGFEITYPDGETRITHNLWGLGQIPRCLVTVVPCLVRKRALGAVEEMEFWLDGPDRDEDRERERIQ